MEEMSVRIGESPAAGGAAAPGRAAPRDLRDWITAVERIGQLKRISEEVSRNEEMGAITYMAHQEIGAPALLFENIKESPRGFRALWNPLGSSVDRFAVAIGEPTGLSVMALIQRCKARLGQLIPPVVVEGEGAAVNENHLRDDKVDIRDFPATWSTWLDPAQNPPEKRPYGSKALINACMEHRYLDQFSRRTKVRRSVYDSVANRWTRLGFSGRPPKLWALED